LWPRYVVEKLRVFDDVLFMSHPVGILCIDRT
jgi:hypothetical protein